MIGLVIPIVQIAVIIYVVSLLKRIADRVDEVAKTLATSSQDQGTT